MKYCILLTILITGNSLFAQNLKVDFEPVYNNLDTINVSLCEEKPSEYFKLGVQNGNEIHLRFVYYKSFWDVSKLGKNPKWEKQKLLVLEYYTIDDSSELDLFYSCTFRVDSCCNNDLQKMKSVSINHSDYGEIGLNYILSVK